MQSPESSMLEYKGYYLVKDSVTLEYLDSLEDFEIRESDVFSVTYPKSGTMWMANILNLIYQASNEPLPEVPENQARVPCLEFNLYNRDYIKYPSPRLFVTHLPYYLVPKRLRSRTGKVIYVVRNPKDVLVSYYHISKLAPTTKETEDFESLMEKFLQGKVVGSSWLDHVEGWSSHRDDFNILFLTYEEMKKWKCDEKEGSFFHTWWTCKIAKKFWKGRHDEIRRMYGLNFEMKPQLYLLNILGQQGEIRSHQKTLLYIDLRSSVRKICNFLGKPLTEKQIDEVADKATFDKMKVDRKANPDFFFSNILDFSKGKFLRKGTIGDWKNTMTVAQNERFDSVFKERVEKLPFTFCWDINDES